MNVTPKGAQAPSTNHQSSSAESARARAIAMLQGAPSPGQQTPPQNNVSPEMMSAVAPPTPTLNEELTEEMSQPDTSIEQNSAPTEEPETPKASSQLAILARKERALRAKQQQQEQSFREREAALKQKEEMLLAKEREYSNGFMSKDLIKQNPLKVLADAGVSYDELTQQVLNQTQTDPYTMAQITKLQETIAKLSSEIEDSKKQSSEQQEHSMTAAMNQIKMDVRRLVSKDPNFETIKATDSIDDVAELIKQTYERDGYVMSVEDAAQEVEDYLLEEYSKLAKLQKIQQRLQPKSTTSGSTQVVNNQQKQTQAPQQKQTQQMKTLTNAASASRPPTARERAILAFNGDRK